MEDPLLYRMAFMAVMLPLAGFVVLALFGDAIKREGKADGAGLLACATVILGICTGCQSFDPGEKIQSWMWHVEKMMRKPGETLVGHPDAVWKEFDCDHQQLPFVAIDLNEVRPPSIAAGNEFGHRLIYAVCPQRV